jgi:hypothetical protein
VIPSIGRIVHYRLTADDATQINRRRPTGVKAGAGKIVHVGNPVAEGEAFPLIITRVWGAVDGGAVNGQVLLDGNDSLWVTSVMEGDGLRHWFVPPRVG